MLQAILILVVVAEGVLKRCVLLTSVRARVVLVLKPLYC